jgi:HSP20 family protein
VLNDGYNFLTKQGYVPVNIKESANDYILEVVAPGFEKADFKVNIDNNVLTVSAEKKSEENKEGNAVPEKQIRKEYSYRSFKRSFTIDDKIDATAVEASYVNGVLKLNLPKKAEVREAVKDIKIN